MPGPNTLAYYDNSYLTAVKGFITLSPGATTFLLSIRTINKEKSFETLIVNVIKLFCSSLMRQNKLALFPWQTFLQLGQLFAVMAQNLS